jgi:hypothetical protein
MVESLQIPDRTHVAFKPKEQDERILARLRQKFGVGDSDVLRMGIRALAEKENISTK